MMRHRLFPLAFAAVAAGFFFSCTDTREELRQTVDEPQLPVKTTVTFEATPSEALTKASLTPDEYEKLFLGRWEEGDVMKVHATNAGASYDDTVEATRYQGAFQMDLSSSDAVGEWEYSGFYPSEEVPFGPQRTQQGNAFNSRYDIMAGSISYEDAALGKDAEGEKMNIPMRRLTSIVYLHLTSALDEKIRRATLTVEGGDIAADNVSIRYYADTDAFELVPSGETSSTLRLDFDSFSGPNAKDFMLWFNVLPVTATSLSITVETALHTLTLSTEVSFDMLAGHLYKISYQNVPWKDKDVAVQDVEMEFTDVDPEKYVYPTEDATQNPNLVVPDYDELTVVSLDPEAKTATVSFSGDTVPDLYRGSILPVAWGEDAYSMFILTAARSGNTYDLTYRDANISEMFYNQTLSIDSDTPLFDVATKADGDKRLLANIGAAAALESGIGVDFKGVDLNLSFKIDMKLGSPITIGSGNSANSRFQMLSVVFTGTAASGLTFKVEPSASAKVDYRKTLKKSAFHKGFSFLVYGVPVFVDFDVDILAYLGMTMRAGLMHYSQDYSASATVKVGAKVDFEKGTVEPVYDFRSSFDKADPVVTFIDEVNIDAEGSIYPRIKTYLYKFKFAGLQTDLMPILGKAEFRATRYNNHWARSWKAHLASRVALNAYYEDPFGEEGDMSSLLDDDITFEKVWKTWESPGEIKDEEPDKVIGGSYNTDSSLQMSVQDIFIEDGVSEAVTPYNGENICVESEYYSMIGDPAADAPKTKAADTYGWVSWGKTYPEVSRDGTFTLPVHMQTPAGFGVKLVNRIVDGEGRVVKEMERNVETAIEEYNLKYIYRSPEGNIESTITVKDYGNYVHEVASGNIGGDMTYNNGVFSGYIESRGPEVTVRIPFGEGFPGQLLLGVYNARMLEAPAEEEGDYGDYGDYGDEEYEEDDDTGADFMLLTPMEGIEFPMLLNVVEQVDYTWWLCNRVGIPCNYSASPRTFQGLECMEAHEQGSGATVIYYKNIVLYINVPGVATVECVSLDVPGWARQL